MKWQHLAECIAKARDGARPPHISLKVVVFDEDDYLFARQVGEKHPEIPLFLQVGNPAPNTDEDVEASALLEKLHLLSERVLSDSWHSVTILPQLHVLIYGNKRGV